MLFVVVYSLSCALLFWDPVTAACQASLSMGFPRQGYLSGLPFLISGDLPDPGVKPISPVSLLHCKLILSHPVRSSAHFLIGLFLF